MLFYSVYVSYSMSEIAAIFEVRYQTVSDWIDAWDDYGLRASVQKT